MMSRSSSGGPILQIRRSGVVLCASGKEVKRLRAEFKRNHCVCLRKFLEPALLKFVLDKLDGTRFRKRIDRINVEDYVPQNAAMTLLELVLNDPELFRAVRRLTGCRPIGSFLGKGLWRLVPGRGHTIRWHSDRVEDRTIQLDISLTQKRYRGGTLQFRNSRSGRILHEVDRMALGDAVLIRLASGLEHRFAPVQGPWARIAYDGWFFSTADHRASLKGKLTRLKER